MSLQTEIQARKEILKTRLANINESLEGKGIDPVQNLAEVPAAINAIEIGSNSTHKCDYNELENKPTHTIILPEVTVTTTENNEEILINNINYSLDFGEKYKVICDGVEYDLVCGRDNFWSFNVITDAELDEAGVLGSIIDGTFQVRWYTNDPDAIPYDTMELQFKEIGTHTIFIYKEEIPSKYLSQSTKIIDIDKYIWTGFKVESSGTWDGNPLTKIIMDTVMEAASQESKMATKTVSHMEQFWYDVNTDMPIVIKHTVQEGIVATINGCAVAKGDLLETGNIMPIAVTYKVFMPTLEGPILDVSVAIIYNLIHDAAYEYDSLVGATIIVKVV